jgi:cobalt-zinc-cadmium efflux system outer membrane protein
MQEGNVPLRCALTLFVTVRLTSMGTVRAAAEQPLTVEQLVEIAVEVNPQIRATKEQWDAAQHQILQNYAPADPTFTYANLESSKDFNAAVHAHSLSESFQFPGKALLQADGAKRTAAIAGLTYEAAMRDLRAGVETAYYQLLLDEALIGINTQNIDNLKQVVHVTQIQYTANQATQADLIGAEFALAQAQLQQRQYQTNRANARVGLNQLLYRSPASPLNLERKIQLKRLVLPLDKAVVTAAHARQEILAAALAEKNSTTALKLAEMEYLPDYTIGYEFDYILQPGAQPLPTVTQGNTFSIGFNLPLFFWIHQREDVHSAQHSLQAARYGMNSVLSQTEATVTQLYQSTQFAYESAQEYSGSLIPWPTRTSKCHCWLTRRAKLTSLHCRRRCRVPTRHASLTFRTPTSSSPEKWRWSRRWEHRCDEPRSNSVAGRVLGRCACANGRVSKSQGRGSIRCQPIATPSRKAK